MAKNQNLHTAKKAKNDEFYTLYQDIENEMQHYTQHFTDKVIYCNCDAEWSNFWKYFVDNFEKLGLKKLVATHYEKEGVSQKLEYNGLEIKRTDLNGDGDFRSDECIALLQEADIVVTNPPFSLFREYVAQLIEYQKHFIIIGNMNAITYKDIFPLIKDNKLWLGPSISSGDREFRVPDDYPLKAAGYRIDADGNKYIRVKGVRWFTNLDNVKRHEEIVLWKNYTAEEYPEYDNYDIINVNKTSEIPCDYDGIMGVPISFIDKYSPQQFEIIGIANSARWISHECITIINEQKIYNRILIRKVRKTN